METIRKIIEEIRWHWVRKPTVGAVCVLAVFVLNPLFKPSLGVIFAIVVGIILVFLVGIVFEVLSVLSKRKLDDAFAVLLLWVIGCLALKNYVNSILESIFIGLGVFCFQYSVSFWPSSIQDQIKKIADDVDRIKKYDYKQTSDESDKNKP